MNSKNTFKNKKYIILAVLLIIIIAGTTIKFIKGMNYNLSWRSSSSIEIYIENFKEKSDLKAVLAETFPKRHNKIQYVEDSTKELLITIDTKQITDEQKDTFIKKVNEKYQTNLTVDEMEIMNNSQVKLSDVIYPNILLIIVTVVIIAGYFITRYRKIGIIKLLEYLLGGIVLTQWVYFSILCICRIPVGSWTIPVSMLIFIVSIIVLIFIFEKEYKKVVPKKNKKKK